MVNVSSMSRKLLAAMSSVTENPVSLAWLNPMFPGPRISGRVNGAKTLGKLSSMAVWSAAGPSCLEDGTATVASQSPKFSANAFPCSRM